MSYQIDDIVSLTAGDLLFLMVAQNTAGAVALSSINGAALENRWSVEAIQT